MEIIQEKLQAAAQHEHIFTCLKQQYIETLTIINRIEEDALDSYRSNLLASATLIWESAREQKVLKRNTLKSACCSIESTLNGYVCVVRDEVENAIDKIEDCAVGEIIGTYRPRAG